MRLTHAQKCSIGYAIKLTEAQAAHHRKKGLPTVNDYYTEQLAHLQSILDADASTLKAQPATGLAEALKAADYRLHILGVPEDDADRLKLVRAYAALSNAAPSGSKEEA